MNTEIKKYMSEIGKKGGNTTGALPDISEIRKRGWKTRKMKAALTKKQKQS